MKRIVGSDFERECRELLYKPLKENLSRKLRKKCLSFGFEPRLGCEVCYLKLNGKTFIINKRFKRFSFGWDDLDLFKKYRREWVVYDDSCNYLTNRDSLPVVALDILGGRL